MAIRKMKNEVIDYNLRNERNMERSESEAIKKVSQK